ncbi:MAG: hypothetical protein Fur0021_12410 [Candidatus Promineifilaceae bacterium]
MSDFESVWARREDELARLPKPSSFELGEYALGLLPAAAAARVKAYLALHPHAAAEVALLQTYLAQGEPTVQPAPGPLARLQTLVMKLLPAAGATGVWAGARGAADAAVYQVGDWQVILDSDDDAQQPGRFVLTGLLLGPETPTQATATLLSVHTPGLSAAALLDEFGNFVLPNLLPGEYDLALLAPQQAVELHIAGITVGSPQS